MPALTPESVAPSPSGPESDSQLSRDQIESIQQAIHEHFRSFTTTRLNHAEEFRFQREVKASPWSRHFVRTFMAAPPLSDPTYDYRGAWREKTFPVQPGEPLPTRRQTGQLLFAPEHPSAWRLYLPGGVDIDHARFLQQVGDPFDVGLQAFGTPPQPHPVEPASPPPFPRPTPQNGTAQAPSQVRPPVPVPEGMRRDQTGLIPAPTGGLRSRPLPPTASAPPSLVPRRTLDGMTP